MENTLDFSTVRNDAREIILALKLLKKGLLENEAASILPENVIISMMNNMPVLNFRSFQVFYDRVTSSYQLAVTSYCYTLGFFDTNTTLSILVADTQATDIANECVTFVITPHEHTAEENYEKLLINFINEQ